MARADTGGIDHVQSRRGSVQVLYTVPGSGDGGADVGSVSVTFNGTRLPARATPASDAGSRIRRTTVLAVDVSNSMAANGKFRAAQQAARVFLRSVPADVRVGIVTFAGKVTVAQKPSLDRATALATVGRLKLSLGTHLYDGVSRAVDVLGRSGQRTVVVLSDGRDTSRTPLARVAERVSATGTKVDVVALAQSGRDRALLAPLARAGDGAVISADDPRQLRTAFSSEARALSDQLLITAETPAGTDTGEGTLSVDVAAGDRRYTDSAFVALTPARPPAAAAPRKTTLKPAESGLVVAPRAMQAGLALLAVAILVLALAILGGLGRPTESLERRIAAYTGEGAALRSAPPERQGAKAQAVELAGKALAGNRDLEARLGSRLEAAGLPLKAAEWLLVHAGIAIGGTAVVFVITGGDALLGAVALLVGLVVPWTYLGIRKSRRLKAFNAQLPATLQLLAGSLQAGLSLAQGMDTIVREGADPIAGEFRRALVETRLGVQVEDALESLAERMDSDDFRWTVMAVRIQREVGGNLAELLLNVAATMREREHLRRQVKSLSAEGRFSAYILLSMPPGVLLYESVANRSYLSPLISTPLGWLLLAGMVFLMALGAFVMTRMIRLEV